MKAFALLAALAYAQDTTTTTATVEDANAALADLSSSLNDLTALANSVDASSLTAEQKEAACNTCKQVDGADCSMYCDGAMDLTMGAAVVVAAAALAF